MEHLTIGGITIPFVPSFLWVLVEFIVIVIIWLLLFRKKSWFSQAFELFFESMYTFFEEILGEDEKRRIKLTIVSIFFVVFIANLLGWLWDILTQTFPIMEEYFATFTSDRNGTFAISILVVLLSVAIQAWHLGWKKFLHEYIPITGKWFLTVEKWSMSPIIFYPMWFLAKIFDIVISLFIWLLDIVWVFAKMISVAFRLYGNMLAGTVLLVLLTEGTISMTQSLIHIDLPIILPLILFVQWLLVATIQAFVVALLSAIFIKVSKS